MSKYRECFIFFLLLITAIAFLCEISVPLIIYLHISSLKDRMDEPTMAPGSAGNDSIAVSYPVRQMIDDNVAIFMCLAGITMFLIGVLLMACRKVRIIIAVPGDRADSFREQYLGKLMQKKAIVAELSRMRAQIPIPIPPEDFHYV